MDTTLLNRDCLTTAYKLQYKCEHEFHLQHNPKKDKHIRKNRIRRLWTSLMQEKKLTPQIGAP